MLSGDIALQITIIIIIISHVIMTKCLTPLCILWTVKNKKICRHFDCSGLIVILVVDNIFYEDTCNRLQRIYCYRFYCHYHNV